MAVYEYNASSNKLNLVAGATLYADAPIGSIQAYGGTTAPSGWLLCQGQAVSRTEYAELFKAIGTAFGTGDGSTTFNVPDLREATTKGVGLSGKSNNHYDSDGVALGEFVDDRIKSHAHSVYVRDTGHLHSMNYLSMQFADGGSGSYWHPYMNSPGNHSTKSASANIQVSSTDNFSSIDNSTTAKGYATNEVKAVGVNYIIKAKQVSVPFDVAEYIRNQNVLSEWEDITLPTNAATAITMEYDGIISTTFSNTGGGAFRFFVYINGIGFCGGGSADTGDTVTVPFKKGDKVYYSSDGQSTCTSYVAYYKLRDYTGR